MSASTTSLWKDALRHLPHNASISRILLVGVGPDIHRVLQRSFSNCRITELHTPSELEQIGSMDLVLFDASSPFAKMETLAEIDFFHILQSHIPRDGFLIINTGLHRPRVSRIKRLADAALFFVRPIQLDPPKPKFLQDVERSFLRSSWWQSDTALFMCFQPFGAGVMGDPLREGYRPFRGSIDYLRREVTIHPSLDLVGDTTCAGLRRRFGPIAVEKFFGDIEPTLAPAGFPRLVIWQPLRRLDVPKDWSRSPFQMNAYITGFVDLQTVADPITRWSSHARRHLKHWFAERDQWIEEEVTFEQFMRAYMQTSMRKSVKSLNRHFFRAKEKAQGSLLRFTGLYRKGAKRFEAGFVTLDVPEISQSIHIGSFIMDEVKDTAVGTGMVYNWFEYAKQKNIRFLDFDLFRGASDPKAWEGFSRFKSQFGTYFIRYPNPLVRWVKG